MKLASIALLSLGVDVVVAKEELVRRRTLEVEWTAGSTEGGFVAHGDWGTRSSKAGKGSKGIKGKASSLYDCIWLGSVYAAPIVCNQVLFLVSLHALFMQALHSVPFLHSFSHYFITHVRYKVKQGPEIKQGTKIDKGSSSALFSASSALFSTLQSALLSIQLQSTTSPSSDHQVSRQV